MKFLFPPNDKNQEMMTRKDRDGQVGQAEESMDEENGNKENIYA